MIITTGSIQHELTIDKLYTIGMVGASENVVYEAVLRVVSTETFDHTVTTKVVRNPQQTGTSTQTRKVINWDEGSSSIAPVAELIEEGEEVYYEYKKTRVGTLIDEEYEVPVFDIDAPQVTDEEVTETKELIESDIFSVAFNTEAILNFVEYSDLTEDVVLSWVPEDTITEKTNDLKTKLLLEKDRIINPEKYRREQKQLPWVVGV